MRPLEPAALAGIRGVAFDIDDTLTTHGRLTGAAYAALERLASAGVRLAAVTGRPLGWADAFAASWPIELAVGENGAGWARREGSSLALGYFDDAPTRAAQRARLEAFEAHVRARMPELRLASDQPARRCDLAFDVGEAERLAPESIAALVAEIERADLRATVSSVHAHAVPGAWDKAAGLVRALGEPAARVQAEWLFIGDSGNDAAAFSFFARTVGVANVREHLARLPDPPRWVTEGARGEGFAELADAVLEAQGG